MIKSTVKVQNGEQRIGVKENFLQIEIARAITTPYNVKYEVEHFAIIDEVTGAKTLIANSGKELSIQEFNQFSGAVDALIQEYDTTQMNAFEKEQLRLKIGLLLYIQTDFLKDENGNNTDKVVWNLLPNQFEIML